MSPRWRKLAGDLRASWGRLLALEVAIALALTGVGVVLGARAVLHREIGASFASTRPADATLELPGGVDAAVLARVRARPEVEDADRRQMLRARIRPFVGAPWQMLVLFVVDDAGPPRLARFTPAPGAWPPPPGTIALERTAPAVIGVAAGEVAVQTPHGGTRTLTVAGTVHDPGQAPAWQEHRGCGYTTAASLAALGEPPVLRDLLVRFRAPVDVDGQAAALAAALRADGIAVGEIRVPPPRTHPHQGLMDAVQTALLVFSLVLLGLAAIVVATVLAAMLARQVRDVGVMKAIGARGRQLAVMYGAAVLALGAVAAAIATPLAMLGARAMIDTIARMMNLAVQDPTIPVWVPLAVVGLGLAVPLAFAAVPIARAARMPVREALAAAGPRGATRRTTWLPLAARNALRRPGRLAPTLALMIIGGALVMTAAGVQRGLARTADRVEDARRYQLEIRTAAPIDDARLAAVRATPGVRAVEAWWVAPAARGPIARTHPDGGHGAFVLAAPPADGTTLARFPLRAGRWLRPDDDDAVVLSDRGAPLGARIELTVDGRVSTWTVVGVADELAGRSAFVTPAAFRRVTGQAGPTLLRIAAEPGTLAGVERALDGVPVVYALPIHGLHSIIADHVAMVVRAVVALAAVVAAVGLLGLAIAMGVSVAERTGELGVMKALGASDRRLAAIVVGEAMAIGAVAVIAALALTAPLTALVIDRVAVIGQPPFALSPPAMVGWALAALIGSALASLAPARRAIRMSVRAALAEA